MPKERSVNPVAAQHKADKRKEIAKNKKQLQSQRNEKLARRNPDRLQRQIDELKELESRGSLRPKDKETLAQLERDVKGIRRAREALGDAAPKFPSHERRDGQPSVREAQQERRQNLGKRRRDAEDAQSSGAEEDDDGDETDPEARLIPMPRDTPPPFPRPERRRQQHQPSEDPRVGPDGNRIPHPLPAKPTGPAPPASKTVYSAAPQLRDLRKEATRFVPAAVAQKKRAVRGDGRLLEPEELEQLEKSGYYAASKAAEAAGEEADLKQQSRAALQPDNDASGADLARDLARLEADLVDVFPAPAEQVPRRNVQVEDVMDSGD